MVEPLAYHLVGEDESIRCEKTYRCKLNIAIMAVWFALVLLGVTLFIAGIPEMQRQLQQSCTGTDCPVWKLPPGYFRNGGPSPESYALFYLILEGGVLTVWVGTSLLLVRRAGRDSFALVTAIMLVAAGTSTMSDAIDVLKNADPRWTWPITTLASLGLFLVLTVFFVFPDGTFTPKWTKAVVVAWAIVCVVAYVVPNGSPFSQTQRQFVVVITIFTFLVIVAQVDRYRQVASGEQRAQIRLVITGVAIAIGGFAFAIIVLGGIAHYLFAERLLARMIVVFIGNVALTIIPLSIGYAVLRRQLWDAEVMVNRVIVYGLLSLFVGGGYVSVVVGVGSQLPQLSTWLSLVVTIFIAVSIQPVRETTQRAVDRFFFGHRSEPYVVVSRLGNRLEGVSAGEAAMTAIVDTVATTMKLPFVEITLHLPDGSSVVTSAGIPLEIDMSWPLLHQQVRIGVLAVSARSRGERLAIPDRVLLGNIAWQAGTVLGAIRATDELQVAHSRLISAREAERRRLRRDLHDGLAPNLASQTLTLDAARVLLPTAKASADQLLDDLSLHMQAAMDDVRRIIDGLRPSALDDLGFAGALDARARIGRTGVAEVKVERQGIERPLPAAVEVAAYWITLEAIANVDRHAHASECSVWARVDATGSSLKMEISDNGCGIRDDFTPGIGLSSMRERASELGGSCVVEPGPTGGTIVRVRLPLVDAEE